MPAQLLPDDPPRLMSLRSAPVDELRRKGINQEQNKSLTNWDYVKNALQAA